MVSSTGSVKETDVGFYVGLIESLFSIIQMLVMISWGRAADRFGRRPVMIISNFGVAMGSILFGFSSTVWQMVLFRCCAGFFAGSMVTIRALFSENSTPKTQARAFSLYAVAGNMGIFLGPFIGGIFAEPVTQYPKVFGNSELFRQYPYALATMVSGAFGLSATLLSIFFLKETLQKKGDTPQDKPMTTRELVKAPGVAIVLFIHVYNIMLALSLTAVLPVFLSTRVQLGGWGCSPFENSILLGYGGLCQALWTLLVFPAWHKRVGTGAVLKILYYIYPVAFALGVLPSIAMRTTGNRALFWVLGIFWFTQNSAMAMTFTGVQLALNDIAPSHKVLGTLNAIALAINCGIRAVAPAIFTSVYAIGVGHRVLGGYLFFLIISLMSCVLSVLLPWMPAQAAGKRTDKPTASENSNDEN